MANAAAPKDTTTASDMSKKEEKEDSEDPGVTLSEFCSDLDDYTPTVSVFLT